MNPTDILQAVADIFSLPVAVLRGRGRSQRVVLARQAAMLLLRDHAPWLSLKDIGDLLDRDHTTVIYGVETAREHGKVHLWYRDMVMRALALAREPKAKAA